MTLDLSTARDRSTRDNLAEAARPGAPPSGDCVAALEEPAASQVATERTASTAAW